MSDTEYLPGQAGFSFYYPNRVSVVLDCGDEMITKQSFKDECDINTIMAHYEKTGIITHMTETQGQYLDLPDSMDFQDALTLVSHASDAFDNLPSVLRDRYKNDPSLFLSALSDPAERSVLTEFGVFRTPVDSSASAPASPPSQEGAPQTGGSSP